MKLNLLTIASTLATASALSTFTGNRVSFSPSTANTCARRGDMSMKKGKPNVPPQMRGSYKRQQEMVAQRDAMMAASQPGADGLPVFNLFIRTKKGNMWYPCGSFKGDERSAALAKSYADDGMLAGISKNQLDKGVAGSIFRDQKKLEESLCRAYPQLRKSRGDFEYGYKLAYEGLSEEQGKIAMITPQEQSGFLDGIKGMFGQ
mmetsp:Transcript_16191/g.25264  ORF Transcript_16191/g.25264 Transcript_16191/m.25264 type:complete len:204 (+) Transcript_16191:148-759(+)|eukprot:CAMPEP_0196810592 /NCGR_PEP_ID=MMETSP1362-20130617/12148_1 /TAXON_ID=163516 /ORGANISM="Leptocylindrus danicus, Strain CCMP1856" /LENGTH=203 /DNA_ID=CAMNT_0042185665 /DNA_START=103 /DNA_END=714 /DNA_ORIENTATION=+